jgi:cell division protein FtsX
VEVFVVLALALAVAATGLVVLAAVLLVGQLRRLRDTVQSTSDRMVALTTELSEEAAVLTLEAEALQRRIAASRRGRPEEYTAKDKRIPAGS